jgi:hypothetical protein
MAERSLGDDGTILVSSASFPSTSCKSTSREESDSMDRGRDPPSLSALGFGLSAMRALCAIALAAASAAQSVVSREGDVPETLTRSVATTAGALAMDVND